jgi:hypothetical protein
VIARVAAGTYVVTVAGLTAYAFRSPDVGFGRAEAAAAILTVPAIVPALPVIYVVGAVAWNLYDAGAPMALVTATFTLMMAGVAALNLLPVWLLSRARRAPSGSAVGGASSPGHPTPGTATTPRPPDPPGPS